MKEWTEEVGRRGEWRDERHCVYFDKAGFDSLDRFGLPELHDKRKTTTGPDLANSMEDEKNQ